MSEAGSPKILRRAVHERPPVSGGLGSRMAARFGDAGLDEDLPELRGQSIDPVAMDQ